MSEPRIVDETAPRSRRSLQAETGCETHPAGIDGPHAARLSAPSGRVADAGSARLRSRRVPATSSWPGSPGSAVRTSATRRRPGCRSLSRTIRRNSSSSVVVGWSTASELAAVPGDHLADLLQRPPRRRSRALIWVTSWTVSRSETLPSSLSSPRWRIAIRSQMSCMSARRWPGEDDRLALARAARGSAP